MTVCGSLGRMNIHEGALMNEYEKAAAELVDSGLVIVLNPTLWVVSYLFVSAISIFCTAYICRRYYRKLYRRDP